MVKTDFHFFSADAVPLILQFLKDKGFKFDSHKAVAYNEVRNVESLCPKNCVLLKVKYDA